MINTFGVDTFFTIFFLCYWLTSMVLKSIHCNMHDPKTLSLLAKLGSTLLLCNKPKRPSVKAIQLRMSRSVGVKS